MKTLLRLASLLAASDSAWGAYQFYVTDPLQSPSFNTSLWTTTGTIYPTYSGAFAEPGSLISIVPIPDGTSDGEVRMTVHVNSTNGTYGP